MMKVYEKLRSKGLGSVLRAGYRRMFPARLQYFSACLPLLEARAGLEIGGPSGIFGPHGCIPVYPVAGKIDACNFGKTTVWEGELREGDHFVFDERKPPGRQYIAEASDLSQTADASYDFVLSSHCLEHMANPLLGLSEWIRVLKQDGLLVLVVPHKDGTFDHRRPVTKLDHLVQDFEAKMTEGDLTHLDEILRLHDLSQDPGAGTYEAFRERSIRNLENRCLHQHVFDTRLAVEVVNHIGLQILAVEVLEPCHIVVIAKKTAQQGAIDNRRFMGIDVAPCWTSPFPSDRAQ
jgi:SAM-dependent methyltransferase